MKNFKVDDTFIDKISKDTIKVIKDKLDGSSCVECYYNPKNKVTSENMCINSNCEEGFYFIKKDE